MTRILDHLSNTPAKPVAQIQKYTSHGWDYCTNLPDF